MASIAFYGGVTEVGGNKFLLKDEDTRIFLDFGKSYASESRYFGFPQPQARDVDDLLELGLLPRIAGLYDEEEERPVEAILLSHPHADHWEYIRYVRDDIPIICGEATRSVILAREKASGASPPIAKLTARGEQVFKKFQTFRTGDSVKVGSIKIKPIHVDHSVPGSYAFLIETADGVLAYTGDFRRHGPRADLTQEFIDKAKEEDVEALIIEGTNIGESEVFSEEEVKTKIESIVKEATSAVLTTFPPYDIDRLRSFYHVAETLGRKLAVPLRLAYLLEELRNDPHLDIFGLDDQNILLYRRRKKTTYEYEKILEEKYGDKIVDAKFVNQKQREIILPIWLPHITELLDIDPDPGSIFISSQSEPFNEEMEIDYERLHNWLRLSGLPHYRVHASGHATPIDLKYLIKEVSPRKVFLVHTKEPEIYRHYIADLGIETLIPEEGKEHVL